jgi:hypothetical protein
MKIQIFRLEKAPLGEIFLTRKQLIEAKNAIEEMLFGTSNPIYLSESSALLTKQEKEIANTQEDFEQLKEREDLERFEDIPRT